MMQAGSHHYSLFITAETLKLAEILKEKLIQCSDNAMLWGFYKSARGGLK